MMHGMDPAQAIEEFMSMDVPPLDENGVAHAGEPLEDGVEKTRPEVIIAALKTCYDPEIPVDIYELGLIYDMVQAENGNVDISMTLTAPGCPVAGTLPGHVAQTVAAVDGVGEVAVALTWDPPWGMHMMSEAARVELDMF